MSIFIPREEPFICEHCGKSVEPLGKGTYRDHCPFCLYAKHVDDIGPGDRASSCLGLMKPMRLEQSSKKGFVIVYECNNCGKTSKNRAAPDDLITNFEQTLI